MCSFCLQQLISRNDWNTNHYIADCLNYQLPSRHVRLTNLASTENYYIFPKAISQKIVSANRGWWNRLLWTICLSLISHPSNWLITYSSRHLGTWYPVGLFASVYICSNKMLINAANLIETLIAIPFTDMWMAIQLDCRSSNNNWSYLILFSAVQNGPMLK